MEAGHNKRTQQTRERLLAAAQRLFLKQGYLATSTDAILAEAGISSKETLYRYYASKEELFAAVMSQLTVDEPGFAGRRAELPRPHDLAALRQALIILAREVLTRMSQPEYLALLRIIIAETPRFPQLGPLFVSTIPQRGIATVKALLGEARAREIIADVNPEAVARALLGGLLTHIITNLAFAEQEAPPLTLAHADELVEVVMRAITPE